ncbi:MAG: peptidoglycan-binding domain-containing protein [bacterium]
MTITQSSTRLVAVAAGSVLALGLLFSAVAGPARAAALSSSQISAIIGLLQSFGADAATVANVTASLNGQPTTTMTTTTTTTGGSCAASFTRTLQVGSTGADVKALQQVLNKTAATMVAASGAGSAGMETMSFGPATKAAVMKFQTANGVSSVGIVGPATRVKLNALCGGTTPNPNPTPGPVGTGLTVMAAAQPANALAPAGSSRIPFTAFTVTASNDGDVTMTGVTVERDGASTDGAWSGVELVDAATGVQIGTSKTLNSNHQATIGDSVVIARGTSRTFMVAANRAAAGSHAGEITSFSIVSVNSTATVNGSFPIVGASNTVNESLVIGSISTSTSSFDPGSNQTKSIGDTNIRFTGLRFSANSAEDVKMMNIRWRQVGSVSSGDLANIVTIVNGTSYPTTVSSDGKYFTSVFPGGITIAKGNSVDAYVQGDLVGSNAAGRTVQFSIDKVTDVYFVGQLYGYGVNFTPAYTSTPWDAGYVFTVNAGTATTISNDTTAAMNKSQNVALNVSNQSLGGFVTDFKGEAVTENSMVINLSYGSVGSLANHLLTNVSVVDENGKTVAGPVDAVAGTLSQMKVTLTDTITFPVGRHTWSVVGKIPSGVSSNETIQASSTPSGWGSPTGQVSGNTISLPAGTFTMNQMTIKAATFAVTVASTPASNIVIAGTNGLLFANVQLDASQSGENVRITSIPLRLALGGSPAGVVGDLNACQLFNAGVAVNTGSNVPSTLTSGGTANSFVLDNSITVAKGTITTLALKCNLSSSVSSGSTYRWSVNSSDTFSATGSSGSTATTVVTTGNSGLMTVGAASFAVTTDPVSPGYTIAAAGTSGVTLGVYKFTATNDTVTLNRVGLSLGTVTASSTAADLSQVSLYNGATLIGTATFTGVNRTATSTLSTPVVVPANGSVTITVKGDLAVQGVNLASNPGALLTVNVDTNGTAGQGNTLGAGTSGNVNASGSTAVSGVRVFRAYPTVAKLSPASASLLNSSSVELYRFSITANGNTSQDSIALNDITVNVATSTESNANGTTTVKNLKLLAYTDSTFSTPVPGSYSPSGQLANNAGGIVSGNNLMVVSPILTMSKGTTYYFKVTGDITLTAGQTQTKGTVTTRISGDSAYPSLATTLLDTVSNIGSNNFIWSPMSSSTSAATTNTDWTNGYNITGLPSGGADSFTLSN